jgi:hypothetical protein
LHAACRIFKNHMPLTTNKDCGKHFPEKWDESTSQISCAIAHQRTLVRALHFCAVRCKLTLFCKLYHCRIGIGVSAS